MNKLTLEIVTPHGEIFNSEIKSVLIPGGEGEFGVLPNHASVISLLRAGVITIENLDSSKELIAIDSGHAKVDESSVIILAQGAVYLGGSDKSISKQKLEEAKALLESAGANSATLAATIGRLDSK
ncbi:ATP synthase F1 subunit epsilon [Campylobacter sp. MG1]|uniref:ATP synthase F1 subunit epsilon n=1 Tax=Campylobacter sp. MG1 TaxID=2976332 RepID=UPI00226D3C1C|nr:ATP synthase F1 subunit epsilon [Campylobacter sp. MG1]